MRSHSRWRSVLLAASAVVALVGCKGTSVPLPGTAQEVQATGLARKAANQLRSASGAGQPYDFYILNLSWSPQYCQTHSGDAECLQHLGFVVHGLWPQDFNGSYPKNCGSRTATITASDWQGLFPSASLAKHEWQTHGVCTPYSSDTYFGLVRQARGKVQIPPTFASPKQPASDTPADIIAQFAKINTGVPAGGVALTCGNNALTAVEICFDKNINPIACQGVHSCGARTIKIPSIGGGAP